MVQKYLILDFFSFCCVEAYEWDEINFRKSFIGIENFTCKLRAENIDNLNNAVFIMEISGKENGIKFCWMRLALRLG